MYYVLCIMYYVLCIYNGGGGEINRFKYNIIDTKQSDLNMARINKSIKKKIIVRTRHCSKNVRRAVLSGEIPIEL